MYMVSKKDRILDEDYCYYITNDAIDRFYNKGGTFSKEELNNINFSKLFNENFVLNKDKVQNEKINFSELLN